MDDQAQITPAVATLPTGFYHDPQGFTRERDQVFRRTWQLMGREADLAEAGDFLADDIGGAPRVVVRAGDGSLRAHHNLCRHRAGPLVSDTRGNCGRELVCRYHGWRYELDGRLRSAVDFGAAGGFDPRRFGLHPVRVETWRGLVFVNLDPLASSLETALAPVDRVWRQHGVTLPPAFAVGKSYELGCDWKVYVENFLEGYHLPTVHPGLTEEVDTHGYFITVEDGVAVQQAVALPNARAANLGLWVWLWPNMGMSIYNGGMMIERISPAAFGRTRLDYFYFHDPEAGADLDNILAVSARTTAEDVIICEQVQKRLDGGVYQRGVLSPRHETAIGWFQSRIRQVHAEPA